MRTSRETISSAEGVCGRRDSLEMLNLFYSPNPMPMMPFYVLPPSCQQLDESLPNEVLSLDASTAAANAQHAGLNAFQPAQVRTLPSRVRCTPVPCVYLCYIACPLVPIPRCLQLMYSIARRLLLFHAGRASIHSRCGCCCCASTRNRAQPLGVHDVRFALSELYTRCDALTGLHSFCSDSHT